MTGQSGQRLKVGLFCKFLISGTAQPIFLKDGTMTLPKFCQ